MERKPIVAPPDIALPDYKIFDYANGIYKIIRFRSTAPHLVPLSARQKKGNDHKLDASLSRARRTVLELALCNPWDWFCTFTISKDKHDRSDLIKWRDTFTQWLRDQRKKGYDIVYVLVPEQHKDGSWHAHGLFKGNIPLVSFEDLRKAGRKVPDKLVENGYYNWLEYEEKFGFCSFAKIKDPVAAGFYVTKYLTKDMSDLVQKVGLHLYYCCTGLNRSELHGEIYGNCHYLDQFLTNKYEFCDTGMTHVRDQLGWDFALEHMSIELLDDVQAASDLQAEVVEYINAVQMTLFDNDL